MLLGCQFNQIYIVIVMFYVMLRSEHKKKFQISTLIVVLFAVVLQFGVKLKTLFLRKEILCSLGYQCLYR